MPRILNFHCKLPMGLHARPATEIENACKKFSSDIMWRNERNGHEADAKSALALVGTDTLHNDKCSLIFTGDDADAAIVAIEHFLEHVLKDEATPPPEVVANVGKALAATGTRLLTGRGVSAGIGIGRIVAIGGDEGPADEDHPEEEAATRQPRMTIAIDGLRQEIAAELADAEGPVAAVLGAHLAFLNDETLVGDLLAAAQTSPCLAVAVGTVERQRVERFSASASAYLRERALDIRDLGRRLRSVIYPGEARGAVVLDGASIVVADELTPSAFLSLNRDHLAGLVLARSGPTSHTVILARAFGIPTVVDTDGDALRALVGEKAVVDGSAGVVAPQPNPAAERYYAEATAAIARRRARMADLIATAAHSADGRRIEIAANIGIAAEAEAAFAAGAEGIGLFRTEMLFMDRPAPPDEEEQLAAYSTVARAAAGRQVIVRTFDIGGDKPVAYLDLPKEANPFLGLRGVRLYRVREDLFRTQIRAILRASAEGPLSIMIPMVSQPNEVRWVREVLNEESRALDMAGIARGASVRLGIMIEIPAAAMTVDQFVPLVDFFSIGSNDLTQYLLAVDRDNQVVSSYYDAVSPAMLRTLKGAIDAAHAGNRWIGLCGELGGDPAALPLLLGLGLDEISLGAPGILATKSALARLDGARSAAAAERAMACDSAAAVRQCLTEADVHIEMPMLSTGCIVLDADWRSKEEAIHGLVSHLWIDERTGRPDVLEAALWQRESTYSTGLGYGIGVPHAKTPAMEQPSIAVARLRQPVEWGSIDGQAVDVVIMLAFSDAQAGEAHLKIFSKLARRIMHADFRDGLRNAPDAEAVRRYLGKELEIDAEA